MEWVLIGFFALWAIRTESLHDSVAGLIGFALILALGIALFWAAVIFPSFAVFAVAITVAGATFYLLKRFALNDRAIGKAMDRRRRELGYDK